MAQPDRIRQIQARLPASPHRESARRHAAPPGHTLVELTVVMLVIGVLASFGVPKFMRSLEQSRVDMAATNLRAIWTAQRLYWLKHQTYAQTLDVLISDPTGRPDLPDSFLDATSRHLAHPFGLCCYDELSYRDSQGFYRSPRPELRRVPGRGRLTIDQTGVVTGSITGPTETSTIQRGRFQ